MKVTAFDIEGLLLIQPQRFEDERGYFYESFNQSRYQKILGENVEFVQDNISSSKINVLRGLHFQIPPMAQGKLVSVLKGSVYDVAIDLRKHSSTYGKHVGVILSRENGLQFWIPPGFAHGFLTLEEETLFHYKCTNYYSTEHEETLLWKDKDFAIDWKINDPIISKKDAEGKDFYNFSTPF
jgi:dTDP-4-dehydrorhamnose 3,5-epimerase